MRVGAEIPRGTVPALCGKKAFYGEDFSAGPHSSSRSPRCEAGPSSKALRESGGGENARGVLFRKRNGLSRKDFKAPGKGVRGEE